MKILFKLLPIMLVATLVYGFQIKNTSNMNFIGNDRLNIRVDGGQVAEIDGHLINGQVYGYLNLEHMNDNECYFQAGTERIDWFKVSIPIQYTSDIGCTVAEPRLCCIKMPDEY